MAQNLNNANPFSDILSQFAQHENDLADLLAAEETNNDIKIETNKSSQPSVPPVTASPAGVTPNAAPNALKVSPLPMLIPNSVPDVAPKHYYEFERSWNSLTNDSNALYKYFKVTHCWHYDTTSNSLGLAADQTGELSCAVQRGYDERTATGDLAAVTGALIPVRAF